MAREFSLAYLTTPGIDPLEQIRVAKECGYDYVSLRTIPMHLPGEPEFLMHKDEALFEATKKALKEYDMKLMDIELARIRPDLDINEYAEGKAGVRLTAEPSATFVWNEECGVFTAEVAGAPRYLGTYNTYNTMSASDIKYIAGENLAKIGVSQFPAGFGTATPAI